MADIKPNRHPLLPLIDATVFLKNHSITDAVCLLGVRGYYLNSMGKPKKNDLGVYDDAIFLISPSVFMSCNANTDPYTQKKGIASLLPGIWRYKLGIHGLSKPKDKRYEALVQAGEVIVSRYGQSDDKGWFGINIHRGGYNSTSSIGCQTIHPDQWPGFIYLVKDQLKKYRQKTVPYLLVENDGTIA